MNIKFQHNAMIYIFLVLALLSFCFSCAEKHVLKKYPSEKISKYSRKDWPHWSDMDKNCINTRHEVLKARSKTAVILDKKGCKVKSGEWNDYYYSEVHTSPKKIDLDHLIPLKHAHENGGQTWSKLEKGHFANDPENLVITNSKYNRKKGAKGIDEWLPVDHTYACRYISDWIRLKKKYKLSFSSSELITIKKAQCDSI